MERDQKGTTANYSHFFTVRWIGLRSKASIPQSRFTHRWGERAIDCLHFRGAQGAVVKRHFVDFAWKLLAVDEAPSDQKIGPVQGIRIGHRPGCLAVFVISDHARLT